jgi:hypothetical protein
MPLPVAQAHPHDDNHLPSYTKSDKCKTIKYLLTIEDSLAFENPIF